MYKRENDWTEEQIAFIKKVWGKGEHTASTIAACLGKSRSAVLGKAHRLKLPKLRAGVANRKARVHKTEARGRITPPAKPKVERAPKVLAEARVKVTVPTPPQPVIFADEQPVTAGTIMALRDGVCRWPVSGEKENTMFCCAPTTSGSWCHKHAKRARVI